MDLTRVILTGWKEVADACGVHERTVKKWHYERKRMPFRKMTTSNQSRLMITAKELEEWVVSITTLRHDKATE